MGTKNNQETTWTEGLDAEHFDHVPPGHGRLLPLSGELPAAERSAQGDAGQVRPGRRARVRHARQVRAQPRHRQRRVGDSPQQHLQRSRPRHGVDRIGARRGRSSCSSAASSRPTTPAASSCTWGDAATIERLLFMMAAREGFGNVLADSTRAVEKGPLSAGGAEVPHRGQGSGPERSARRAHPQGVRARARGGHARHGSPAQSRHARDQRAHQRQPGLQDRALRRPGQRRADQLRGQGTRGARVREHLRGRRFGRHVPLHDEAVQQPVAARHRGVPQPARQRDRPAVHRRRARAVRPQRDGRRAADQPSSRRAAQGRHAARSLVRRAESRRSLQGRAHRSRRSSTRCCRASTRSRG